jgi:histidinol dehydrogenase
MRILRHGSAAARRFMDALPRAARPRPAVTRAVSRIVDGVRREGDRAVLRYTARFDGVRLSARGLRVPPEKIRALAAAADPALVAALRAMARRIEAYHRRQLRGGFRMRLTDGSTLDEVVTPLDSVGLYVPGGSGAYPSSVLMNAIPARVAGVPAVTVVTPPRTLEENPAVAAALLVAGVEGAVFRVGGAQAIAALAFGTARIPAVAKIVGPGNAFVAEAKRQVRGIVEIDQEAGPSEIVILADGSADAGWVAADLLAQAEHGSGDETAVLVTTSAALAEKVVRLASLGLRSVANRRSAARALRVNGAVILARDMAAGLEVVNTLAAEHVEVMCRGAAAVARKVVAGAVFVGPFAPVAVGDYGIGPNHVLPTGGAARSASGLSVADFQRRHGRVRMTERGLRRVAGGVVRVALAEGFRGHAKSVLVRFAG